MSWSSPSRPTACTESRRRGFAAAASSGEPVRLVIARAEYRPARADEPSHLDLDGGLEGRFVDGAMAYSGERLAFSSGELRRARVRIASDASGRSATSLSAEGLVLDL